MELPTPRLAEERLRAALGRSPAVALLGPRQVGKTTLARRIAQARPDSVYLDLESERDRARLADPRREFDRHRLSLVVLDEVQHLPGVYAEVRGAIDADRRPGRFLLLGSAAPRLLRQTSESLAGRLEFIDMAPLLVAETCTEAATVPSLWLRGGFPPSFLAADETASLAWREGFLRALLERDLPALGLGIAPETLRRFWRMLAHLHGQLFHGSNIAASLGVSPPTSARYLDALTGSLFVRRLEPFHANLGKRLVKSPRIYVRDSGLLHQLLGIRSLDDLSSHPVAGPSWEGFLIEQVCGLLPAGATVSFYRTAAGAELDLVVERGPRRIAFEMKLSSAPRVSRGFWIAREDLEPAQTFVVAPVSDPWFLGEGVEVISPLQIPRALEALA